jgi:hypothetical protein
MPAQLSHLPLREPNTSHSCTTKNRLATSDLWIARKSSCPESTPQGAARGPPSWKTGDPDECAAKGYLGIPSTSTDPPLSLNVSGLTCTASCQSLGVRATWRVHFGTFPNHGRITHLRSRLLLNGPSLSQLIAALSACFQRDFRRCTCS